MSMVEEHKKAAGHKVLHVNLSRRESYQECPILFGTHLPHPFCHPYNKGSYAKATWVLLFTIYGYDICYKRVFLAAVIYQMGNKFTTLNALSANDEEDKKWRMFDICYKRVKIIVYTCVFQQLQIQEWSDIVLCIILLEVGNKKFKPCALDPDIVKMCICFTLHQYVC